MYASDEALGGVVVQLKDYQSDTILLDLLPSTSFTIPLPFENSAQAMMSKFFKNKLISHVYHLINEKGEVYDEEYSVKAVLDEASSDTSSTETLLTKSGPSYYYNNCNGIIIILNIAMFCLSVILFGISGYRLMKPDDLFDNSILRKSSEHSPIFDQIHVPLVEIKRNGSFTDPPHPSIYRQPPSPEVDAAWNRLGNINLIPMTSEDVRKRGVDPLDTAKFPDSFGFGGDAHIGRLDVFHQIHCLNALRREIYFDFYYGGKFVDDIPTPSHRAHVSHCLEIVLQALTCSASVEPIMHYWVDIQQMPFPNFNDKHICRDFDTILKWQEEKSVDLSYFKSTIRRPQDAPIHHMSEAYKHALSLNQIASNKIEVS